MYLQEIVVALRVILAPTESGSRHFEATIQRELQKISAFFIEKEEELEASLPLPKVKFLLSLHLSGKFMTLVSPGCKRVVGLDALTYRSRFVFQLCQSQIVQAMMQNLKGKDAACLATFRAEVLELRKYAVLNSTAAIKAVKKRNRHLRVSLGSNAHAIRATDLLSQQHFFTSSKLAALSTQAEILAQV